MITSSQQYSQVVRNPGIVVVRCTADWCAPCKSISRPYSELKLEGVRFYTIDVERVEDFADVESAKKLPCFFIFKDGKPQGMVVGANLQSLTAEIKKL
jgi:thioredoxin 1